MSTKYKWFVALFLAGLFLSQPTAVFAEGKFTFTIVRDGNVEDEKLADYIEKKGTFRKIIDALNKTLVIPYDINIVLTNSKYGPHYEPDKKLIVLDYGDERWSAEQYDKNNKDADPEERQMYLNNINLFSFYHELGHALIDAYKIPVVGEEEDAADALASVMILYYFDKGPQILLDNTDYFDSARVAGEGQENQYWDEHALNEQRYYRLLCYAYGRAPNYIEKLLPEYDDNEHTLRQFLDARKDRCLRDYKTVNTNWFSILKPHFVNQSEAQEAINSVNSRDAVAVDKADGNIDDVTDIIGKPKLSD